MLTVSFSGRLVELLVQALEVFLAGFAVTASDKCRAEEPAAPPPPSPAEPVHVNAAPPPAAPAAPAAPSQIDKTGLPWDARIHSTPAKLTQKGEWRARRGVDPTEAAAIAAKLRGDDHPPAPPPPPPAAAPAAPPPPPPPPATEPPAPATTPSPPATEPPAPATTPLPPAPGAMTFVQFIQACQTAGIPNDARDQAAQSVGLLGVTSLASQPDKIAKVAAALGLA